MKKSGVTMGELAKAMESSGSLGALKAIGEMQMAAAAELSSLSGAAEISASLSAALNVAKMHADRWKRYEDFIKPSMELIKSIERLRAADFTNFPTYRMLKQVDTWHKLVAGSLLPSTVPTFDHIMRAAKLWQSDLSALATAMCRVNLPELSPVLSKSLVLPHSAYTTFAEDTARKIRDSSNVILQSRLAQSVSLSELALSRSAKTVCRLLELPVQRSRTVRPPMLNLPYLIRDEVVNADSPVEEATVEALDEQVISSSYARLVTETVDLWVACNESAKTYRGSPVFATTDRVVSVVNSLPHLVAVDEPTFTRFVLYLAFLIHESADTKKPRYLLDHGGTLDLTQCGVVDHIKTLRNKLLCHDPDQDTESRRRKSREKLRVTLEWLGVRGAAFTDADYGKMQRRLMEELRTWLYHLHESLYPAGTAESTMVR